MMSIAEALAHGTRMHQAGRLAEAEQAYRQILAAQPNHPHALHQLGLLALQARQFEAAAGCIERAIAVLPREPAFRFNLAEAYRHLRRHDEAIACCRTALRLQPGLSAAHAMLGTLLTSQGRLDEASAELRQALAQNPRNARARAQLGRVLHEQDEFAEAEAAFVQALRDGEDSAETHFALGSARHAQGKRAEAIESYRAALARDPNQRSAMNNLAILLKQTGELDQARQHFEAALRLGPDAVSATNLAVLHAEQGRSEASIESYRAAIAADPKWLPARTGLGNLLLSLGRYEEAQVCFAGARQADPRSVEAALLLGRAQCFRGLLADAVASFQAAIALDPNCADAYNDLGKALSDYGHRDEAIASTRRALELNPNLADACNNLAVSLQNVGQMDEAIRSYRRAVELSPDNALFHSNLVYALNVPPELDPQSIFQEHRAWAARHADRLTTQAPPHPNDRAPDRRLRIGYVSPYFMEHAVNFFVEPILAAHDHQRFEIFCYSDVLKPDQATQRLEGFADRWHSILGEPEAAVAERIRRDRIDILVDLTGHIGGNRLSIFARKPAPIQVTYIGYQNTTGMLAMDYRLTDAFSDPPGQNDSCYTEKLVRLPTTFFCYLPSADAPEPCRPPIEQQGSVTFGSVNNFAKITPQALDVWARLLARVEGSRLILLVDVSQALKSYVEPVLASHGVAADRIEWAHRRPRPAYLELIQRMDIALAPFPFNGHTTTCDALWQGVPVVSMVGETYVSRYGSSALATLGLEELIAHSPEEYIAIAARLAADPARLAELRLTLRERFRLSPLCDFAGFTRNLEAAYREMWTTWCRQAPAR